MTVRKNLNSNTSFLVFKVIFFFCSFYFLLMGTGLIFLPRLLLNNLSEPDINPAIIGILRGAGGSILPYSLLYIIIALNPLKRKWGLYIIFIANVIAIVLDITSVVIGEYMLSNAMMDIPFEVLSILGIFIILPVLRKTNQIAQ